MNIAITGSSGLLGSALLPVLAEQGHHVMRFVRSQNQMSPETIFWNAGQKRIESTKLSKIETVIHLAGESVAQRWTPAAKQKIRQSRVDATHFLCEHLAKLKNPPSTLICASAIGYYGSGINESRSNTEMLVEASPRGQDFLSEVVSDWEDASSILQSSDKTRVIHLRLGMVISPDGGALKKMLPVFKLGMGGILGTGEQWMSWISHRDFNSVILHFLNYEKLQGTFNLVCPKPVTNGQFTKILGKIMNRPTLIPMPKILLKTIFGDMAEAILLANHRVYPERLLTSGFKFQDSELETTLNHILGKNKITV